MVLMRLLNFVHESISPSKDFEVVNRKVGKMLLLAIFEIRIQLSNPLFQIILGFLSTELHISIIVAYTQMI